MKWARPLSPRILPRYAVVSLSEASMLKLLGLGCVVALVVGTVFRFTMLAQGLSEAKLCPKAGDVGSTIQSTKSQQADPSPVILQYALLLFYELYHRLTPESPNRTSSAPSAFAVDSTSAISVNRPS